MVRLIGQLLVLVSVLLMPLGMSTARAVATHGATAGMAMDHCPDQGSKQQSTGSFTECTMACAAALPAADLRTGEPAPIERTAMLPAANAKLRGLHPETATPPPRSS